MTTSTHLAGFALPAGNRTGPNCGVTAVAVVAGVSFAKAWDACRALKGRKGNWKGRTFWQERAFALSSLGVAYVERETRPGCTVATFAKRTAKSPQPFMICDRGHCMVVWQGWIIDQFGARSPLLHPHAKRRVAHVVEFPGRSLP